MNLITELTKFTWNAILFQGRFNSWSNLLQVLFWRKQLKTPPNPKKKKKKNQNQEQTIKHHKGKKILTYKIIGGFEIFIAILREESGEFWIHSKKGRTFRSSGGPCLGEIIRSSWWTSDVIHHSSKRLPPVYNCSVIIQFLF